MAGAVNRANGSEVDQPVHESVGSGVSGTSLLRAASAIVERAKFAIRHGLSFEGKRDLYLTLGYEKNLTADLYRGRYQRGGIAERIVEALPSATWPIGTEIIEDPDPNVVTEFESQVTSLFDRLDVWARLRRADILSGLGEYSVLIIGDGEDLSKELGRLSGPDSILYLTPLAQSHAKINKEVDKSSDPRFGLPLTYTCSLSKTLTKEVHWSRVIHIADGLLESDTLGKPTLESVWNYLDDLAKLVGGGAESAWNRMQPGMHANINGDGPGPTDEQLAEFAEEIEKYQHGLGTRVIRTRNVDLNLLQSAVANFGPNVDCIMQLIAGTKGIPYRILTGSERGELASTQDESNWQARYTERRGRFAVPVVRQLTDRLIEYRGLVSVPEYFIVWPDEDELSEKDKASVIHLLAQANQAQGGDILNPDEMRDRVYGLDPLEEAEDEEAVEDDGKDNNDDNSDGENDGDPDNADELEIISASSTSDCRVIIVGGPRKGKSTLARSLRNKNIPTFCGDPASMVKDREEGVTYLPDGLDWSASSQYVVDNWFTQPGPWCCEGVSMARALRKAINTDKLDALSGVEIVVVNRHLSNVQLTTHQEAMAKGVWTVWSQIADCFPDAKYLEDRPKDGKRVVRSASVSTNVLPNKSDRLKTVKQRLATSRPGMIFRVS